LAKVLVVTNNPARASFRQRVSVHLDALRAAGIDCEVAKLPPGALGRFELWRRAAQFDGVFLQKKALNPRDAFLLRMCSRTVMYDLDDAIMYNSRTPDRDSFRRLRSFRRTARLARMVIAGNSYLAEHAERFNSNVEVLPTGLDTGAYKLDVPPERDGKIRLVWIGSKGTLRYLAEIKAVLEEIGSRHDGVALRIICDDFFDLENMPVEKRFWSLERQAPDLVTGDIGLAPLPDNRFTRGKCGFKVLQYAAAGLPVVASPVGVNSEYVRHGTTGFLAANKDEWLDAIRRLIHDPQLRNEMGEKNRIRVRAFDVIVLGKRLAELIRRCLG